MPEHMSRGPSRRHGWRVSLLAGLLALCCSAQALPLANPGFEGGYVDVASSQPSITGRIAKGWSDNSAYGDVTVNYSRQTTHPHSGKACQQVDLTSVKAGQFEMQQLVHLGAGRLATPGLWVRGQAGTRINLMLSLDGPPYSALTDTPVYLSPSWQFVSVPAHVTRDLDLVFKITATQPTRFCLDDASLPDEAGPVLPELANPTPDLSAFGLHINSYLASKGPFNLDFEQAALPVNSPRSTITGQIGNHWFDNSDWADVTVAYSLNTSSPHGGSAAQRIDFTSQRSGQVQLAQLASLRRGERYTASAWMRGTPGMQLELALRQWDAPYTDYASTAVTADGSWQYLSTSGTMTAQGISAVMVRTPTPGTLDVDDARLEDSSGQVPDLSLPWPQTRFGVWRLWDQQGTTWAALEPAKGRWQHALLDQAVDEAQAHGTQIALVLGQSPTWASARPTEPSFYGAGAAAEPRNLNDWVDYLRHIATRYKGRIFLYEMWNEPNDPNYFSGSLQSAVELTRLARQTLKAVDPRIQLIGAAPYSVGYLQQYLAAGAAQEVDIVGYHIYNAPPEDDARVLADLRRVQALTSSAGKPLWITEGATGNAGTPTALGAGLLARKYLVELTHGASRFNWYVWGPATPFCLATSTADQSQPNAAGVALGTLATWLVGSTLQDTAVTAPGEWQILLRQPGGSPAYIVWNPGGQSQWPVPAGFTARELRHLDGRVRKLSGPAQIAVGPEPVLIVGR